MRVHVSKVVSSISKGIQITRVWASDGWCYIPQFQKRQRFLAVANSTNELEIVSEPWSGVIPFPVHYEVLLYATVGESPLIWEESGKFYSERYEESTPNTKHSSKKLLLQVCHSKIELE